MVMGIRERCIFVLFCFTPAAPNLEANGIFFPINEQRRYPIALLQSYPEDEVCSNANGDLIYGHVPLDANLTWRKFLSRPLQPPPGAAPSTRKAQTQIQPMPPAELARAAAIYPVVMLRDPLERVVSFANFLNLDQQVFEQFPERLACNQQTSMVNGVAGTGGGCGVGVLPGATDLWSSFAHLPGSCSHSPKAAVAEAQRRLVELFYFVGVTEEFVGSMFLLQRTFGWGPTSVQMAFQKSMKSFCDGECKKRYKVRAADQVFFDEGPFSAFTTSLFACFMFFIVFG
jgi:hypothetical protein